MHDVKRIAVEGNIAAGKSSFLHILKEEFNFVVVPEPITKWQNVIKEEDSSQQNGGNLLGLFYDDPHRWGYTFQSYAFLSRMRAQLNSWKQVPLYPNRSNINGSRNAKSSKKISIQFFERSVYSDRYCFAQNCHENQIINDVEWNIYKDWHDFLIESFGELNLDGFVYLQTKPETCFHRLKKRNRFEETSISLDYLKTLHEKHEDWLIRKDPSLEIAERIQDTPILVVNCDDEFISSESKKHEMVQKVHKFVSEL